jgi:DNA primase
VYAVLDADAAGQEASAHLVQALGSRVIPVALPPGIKDPAELAPRPDGDALFRAAIGVAVGCDLGTSQVSQEEAGSA